MLESSAGHLEENEEEEKPGVIFWKPREQNALRKESLVVSSVADWSGEMKAERDLTIGSSNMQVLGD